MCMNFETQPPSSICWVALSSAIGSLFVCLSRIGDTSSHLHYMMFPTIQTIYFLWVYDPGNKSVSTYLLLLSWAQFTVVSYWAQFTIGVQNAQKGLDPKPWLVIWGLRHRNVEMRRGALAEIVCLWECSCVAMMKCDKDEASDDEDDDEGEE